MTSKAQTKAKNQQVGRRELREAFSGEEMKSGKLGRIQM